MNILKKKFLHIALLTVFLSLTGALFSTHLVGGFISYEYKGRSSFGARYLITITAYRDCSKPLNFPTDINVCIFHRSDLRLYSTINFPRTEVKKVDPVGRTDCPEATQVCLEKATFQKLVDLETSSFGYFVKWEICCRNDQVNLKNDQDGQPFIGQTYETVIPPTNVVNSSPFFTDVPVPFICVNDTTQLNNYAIDPDGDSLVYRLATPWYGATRASNYPDCSPRYEPPTPIALTDYKTGYNGSIPFGSDGISLINSSNGITTFMAKRIGNYAVAIDLIEYRNGIELSRTRLDLQILIINCTPNNKPVISTSQKSYTIMAGENICFDVTSTDKDNHNITLTGIGDILTGANGFTGNRATFPNAFAKGSVSSRFCWQTSCNQARNSPYLFTAKAVDDGCPSKFTFVNVEIFVKPFTAVTTLNGPTQVCQGAKDVSYTINTTANSPDELTGLTYTINVSGGVLLSQTGNTIRVSWNKGITQGSITITPVSRFSCQGQPFTLQINLLPAAATPLINGLDTVCENASAVYNTAITNGYTYNWWISNGSILGSSNSSSVNVSWGSPGKAQLKLVQYSQNGCPSDTAKIEVWVSKPQTPDILGKQSICPNSKGLEYSVASNTSGSSFYWVISGGVIAGSANGNSIKVNWGNEGLGYVKVLEINKFGCKGDTVYLPVNKTYNLISDFIEGDTDVCEFTTAQIFRVPFVPNTVYNWSVSGGNLVSGQGSHEISIDWGSSGTGRVEMYETSYDSVNAKACTSLSVYRTINIRPYPTANLINGVPEICQFSPPGIYTVNGNPNSSYLWKINGDSNGITGQGTRSITLNYNLEGLFKLEAVETTEFGCQGQVLNLDVIVHPKPRTEPILGDSIVCSPNLLNYPYSTKGFQNSTYFWFIDGGNPVSPSSSENINVNWSGQQLNKISVLEISDFGCPGDTQHLHVFYDNPYLYLNYITVNPPPREDDGLDVYWTLYRGPRYNNQFFIEKRKAGSGNAFTTVGTVNGSVVNFNDFNTFNDSNAWEYRVKGFDLCGKALYTSVHTNIFLKGRKVGAYDVSMDFTPYLGWGNAQIQYDLFRMLKNKTGYELFESNITSFNAASSTGLEHYTQCYRVRGTKVGTDTVTWSNDICFNFEPIIFIPNAFSPNLDDYNDVFKITGGALKTVDFYIYNRWGEKLFIGKSLEDTWNGKYKGVDQPQDVYMYYCYYTGFDGRKYSTKGTITLLR